MESRDAEAREPTTAEGPTASAGASGAFVWIAYANTRPRPPQRVVVHVVARRRREAMPAGTREPRRA